MAVKLKLDSDWWIFTMRENDVSKTRFKEDIKSMLLESGDALNRAIREEINEADAVMDKEAQAHFSNGLKCQITSATDLQVTAEAGFLFDKYDEKNPAQGVKALWLNYGTKPRYRKTGTTGQRVAHLGSIKGGFFINKARKKAAKKIHDIQVRRVNEALDRYGADRDRRPIID